MNKLFSLLLAIGLCISMTGCSSGDKEESSKIEVDKIEESVKEKQERKPEDYKSVEFDGLVFELPDYYGENESDSKDSLYYYAERSSKMVYLCITSMDAVEDEGDFSDYYNEIVDGWTESFVEDSKWDNYKEYDSKLIKTDSGLEASETNYYIHYADDDQSIPFDCVLTIIHNEENNKLIVASLMQSQEADYEYREEFRKMMKEVKLASAGDSTQDSEKETQTTDPAPSTDSSLIRPEFKQTMDNYEAWFDHYCEVMQAYKDNPSDMNLMIEMTNLLSEEVTMLDEMQKMDQSQMNAAELAYYIEVTGRIQQKLIAVGS